MAQLLCALYQHLSGKIYNSLSPPDQICVSDMITVTYFYARIP